VLFLHVFHQLVQLLRIVSVWNSVTVENSQVNVSNVRISCSKAVKLEICKLGGPYLIGRGVNPTL